MKTTISNGATSQPTEVYYSPLQRWNTGSTNVRNLSKSKRRQRIIEERERVELSFSRVLGIEKLKNRAEQQRNDYAAHRAAKKATRV